METPDYIWYPATIISIDSIIQKRRFYQQHTHLYCHHSPCRLFSM